MQKNRVLIIEDDEDLREGLSFPFLGYGYEVLDVGTKKEVLKEKKYSSSPMFVYSPGGC